MERYVYPPEDILHAMQKRIAALEARLQPLQPGIYPEDWHYVGATGEPAFQNSWVNNGGLDHALAFSLNHGNYVHIQGAIKTGASGNTAFTLPAQYRPNSRRIIPINSIGAGFASVIILTDGTVTPYGTPPFSFDGVVFRIH